MAQDPQYIELEPQEQLVLERIHSLRQMGISLRRIAQELNEAGLRVRRGSPWRMEYVARLLRAEAPGEMA